jgi:cation diffusion facilitator family transporter
MTVTDSMHREKSSVALSSVGAAVGLTSIKLIVGIVTGSLGILAEAAHSGLDLVAALMTLFAVRFSSKPADETHHYGHGKVENLSAFLEGGLLLLTAVWVIYEAIRRLRFNEGHIELSFWAFAVMIISIGVDYTRSRVLLRVARKVGSQALEADALHFSTDIWSSSVVIAGLAVVGLAQRFSLPSWMEQADAIAALGVSGIVIWVSLQLIRETVDALLDHAPTELLAKVQTSVSRLQDVIDVRRMRMRRVGNKYFADVIITAPRTATFTHTHSLTEKVEDAIKEAIHETEPLADIDTVVHIEPTVTRNESVQERIALIASQQQVNIHDIHVREVAGHMEVDFDIEVPGEHALQEVHEIASQLEQAIQMDTPDVVRVTSHLEAPPNEIVHCIEVTDSYKDLITHICQITDEVAGRTSAHDIHLYQDVEATPTSALDVVLHATFPSEMSIHQVHNQAEAMKRALRANHPNLGAITIHTEPPEVVVE